MREIGVVLIAFQLPLFWCYRRRRMFQDVKEL